MGCTHGGGVCRDVVGTLGDASGSVWKQIGFASGGITFIAGS